MSEEPKKTDFKKLITEGAVVGTVFAVIAIVVKGLIGRVKDTDDEA